MRFVWRSMLLVLLFLLLTTAAIATGFLLLMVVLILLARLIPELNQIGYSLYWVIVLLLVSGSWIFVMGLIIGKPLLAVIQWLKGLSEGQYDKGHYEENFSFLWNDSGKIKWFYVLFKDIVYRLQELTESLSRSRRHAESSEQVKERWLSGVSHDLKTPLTYAKGYLDIMTSSEVEMTAAEREHALYIVKQKIGDIESMIDAYQIRQQGSTTAGARADLVRFLRDITLDVANNPRSVTCLFSFESNVPAFEHYFDWSLLQRVMQNLLMNAVLHNPEGTEIGVSLRISSLIAIEVSDNGLGMPPVTLERLFKYGERGETPAAGEGIGLAVVRILLEEQQGTIAAESAPGKGTTFTIRLPLRQGA